MVGHVGTGAIVGLAAAIFVEVALASPGSAQDALRVGIGQGLVNPDPHTSTLYSDVRILEQIYEGLLRVDPVTLQPVPALAQSFEIAANKLTWTFHLRPGVTFHNGAPLSSADVKYSIDRIRNEKTGATLRSDYDPVTAVEAPDAATVVMRLKQPFGVLAQVLATPVWSAIVPKDAADLGAKPNGTGPFSFVAQVPKTSVSLARNPHFHEPGLPKLAGVEFIVVPDESARLAALQSHQVDVIDTVSLPLAKTLTGRRRGDLAANRQRLGRRVRLQRQPEPFDDPRVRRAIAMAINKPQVTAAATFGLGKPAATMVSASPIKLEVDALPYDPAKAKALLAEAGIKTLSFSFAPCGGTAFPQMSRAGEVISANLKAIGVDAKLTSMEASVWVDQVINKHDYDAFICGLINGTDPDQKTFRYFTTHGAYNFSLYKPAPGLDALMQQGREQSDPIERGKTYSAAWTQLLQDSPWVPLYVHAGSRRHQRQGHGAADHAGQRPRPDRRVARTVAAGMRGTVLRRMGGSLLLVVAISLVAFGLARALPGDPAEAMLGLRSDPLLLAQMRAQLGIDRPWPVQYLHWAERAAVGDLGVSMATTGAAQGITGQPVIGLVLQGMRVTLALTLLGTDWRSRSACPPGCCRRHGPAGGSTERSRW